MSPARQDVVDKAFAKMDKDGSGVITTADMKGVYSAVKHPKFISGEKSEDQIFKDYLAKFGDADSSGAI